MPTPAPPSPRLSALDEIERLIGAGAVTQAIAALDGVMAEAPTDRLLQLEGLLLKGSALVDAGRLDEGLTAALQAADMALALALPAKEGLALCLQARVYLTGGLSAEAMTAAAKALALGQSLKDKPLEARALLRMSTFAIGTGDEDQARNLLERSLMLAKASESLDDAFWALNDMSHLQGVEAARLAEAGEVAQLPAAVDALRATVSQALALAERTGHWLQQAFAISNLADAHIVLRDHVGARTLVAQYAALAQKNGSSRLLAYANLDEARLLRAEGRRSEAVALLTSVGHQAHLSTSADLTFNTTEALVRLHKEMGNFEAALEQMEKMRTLERSMMARRSEQQLRLIVARSDLERAKEAENRALLEAERLAVKAQMMEVERDLLRYRSRVDGLTGIGNRSAAEEDLLQRLTALGATQDGFIVAFVDVDNFKTVNDQFGHDIGDRVLQTVGQLIRAGLPKGDEVYRFGGDEFILLLSDHGKPAAKALCERLCARIAAFDWAGLSPGLGVTASFGVADWRGEVHLNGFLARADAAMYQAKREGRNKVFIDWT